MIELKPTGEGTEIMLKQAQKKIYELEKELETEKMKVLEIEELHEPKLKMAVE